MSAESRSLSGLGVPVLALAIGALYLAFGLANGHPGQGIAGLAVMIAYVLALRVWRHRYETVQLLDGRPSDERQALVLQRASALTGQVLVLVLLGGFLVSLALNSHYAVLFSSLTGVGGITFIASTAWYSRRG